MSSLLASLKAEVVGVGPGRSIESKAKLAEIYYAANDTSATCAILTAFGHEVRAQTGKTIQPDLATKLISDVSTIQAALSCPY